VRELTVDEFVSLDGFGAGASGEPDFALGDDGPEFAKFQMRVINEPQVVVLGRNTYENMSRWFPSAPGPFAAAMNGLPKLVFSHTLSEPLSWSNARVARDPAAEITALKQEAGPPLHCIGSLTLAREMMALGLVDRLRLVVFPRILGGDGQQPLFSGYGATQFKLSGTTVIDSAIVLLDYQRIEG
jgi:dihydrofolate reductase